MNPPEVPRCFFLPQGKGLLWIEVNRAPFSRHEISRYLERVREVQSSVSSELSAVLIAPDFEAGVEELLSLVRVPIRLLKYRETLSPNSGLSWWLEEMILAGKVSSSPPEEPPMPSHRLSREELREFIQLEIDDASARSKYKS